jgi:predicted Zn-dependent protease
MKTKTKDSHEFRIYIGSLYEPNRVPFYESKLALEIGKFQDDYDIMIPIRLTRTAFVCGLEYAEDGWEIAIINYPRLKVEIEDLELFAERLAEYLLDVFQQKRVTLITPSVSIMYEEENHFE